MDDRYAKAILDELERVGDLLDDLIKIQTAQFEPKSGLPTRTRRKPSERRSVRLATEIESGQR